MVKTLNTVETTTPSILGDKTQFISTLMESKEFKLDASDEAKRVMELPVVYLDTPKSTNDENTTMLKAKKILSDTNACDVEIHGYKLPQWALFIHLAHQFKQLLKLDRVTALHPLAYDLRNDIIKIIKGYDVGQGYGLSYLDITLINAYIQSHIDKINMARDMNYTIILAIVEELNSLDFKPIKVICAENYDIITSFIDESIKTLASNPTGPGYNSYIMMAEVVTTMIDPNKIPMKVKKIINVLKDNFQGIINSIVKDNGISEEALYDELEKAVKFIIKFGLKVDIQLVLEMMIILKLSKKLDLSDVSQWINFSTSKIIRENKNRYESIIYQLGITYQGEIIDEEASLLRAYLYQDINILDVASKLFMEEYEATKNKKISHKERVAAVNMQLLTLGSIQFPSILKLINSNVEKNFKDQIERLYNGQLILSYGLQGETCIVTAKRKNIKNKRRR